MNGVNAALISFLCNHAESQKWSWWPEARQAPLFLTAPTPSSPHLLISSSPLLTFSSSALVHHQTKIQSSLSNIFRLYNYIYHYLVDEVSWHILLFAEWRPKRLAWWVYQMLESLMDANLIRMLNSVPLNYRAVGDAYDGAGILICASEALNGVIRSPPRRSAFSSSVYETSLPRPWDLFPSNFHPLLFLRPLLYFRRSAPSSKTTHKWCRSFFTSQQVASTVATLLWLGLLPPLIALQLSSLIGVVVSDLDSMAKGRQTTAAIQSIPLQCLLHYDRQTKHIEATNKYG